MALGDGAGVSKEGAPWSLLKKDVLRASFRSRHPNFIFTEKPNHIANQFARFVKGRGRFVVATPISNDSAKTSDAFILHIVGVAESSQESGEKEIRSASLKITTDGGAPILRGTLISNGNATFSKKL